MVWAWHRRLETTLEQRILNVSSTTGKRREKQTKISKEVIRNCMLGCKVTEFGSKG